MRAGRRFRRAGRCFTQAGWCFARAWGVLGGGEGAGWEVFYADRGVLWGRSAFFTGRGALCRSEGHAMQTVRCFMRTEWVFYAGQGTLHGL